MQQSDIYFVYVMLYFMEVREDSGSHSGYLAPSNGHLASPLLPVIFGNF
jgi:hypothetical protein